MDKLKELCLIGLLSVCLLTIGLIGGIFLIQDVCDTHGQMVLFNNYYECWRIKDGHG